MSHFFKNIREYQIKVGIFVAICLVIVFFSYNWLMDRFSGNKYEKYQVLFDSVSNLERGNSVFFRGVRVGKVISLSFTDDGILLDLMIERNLKIDKKAAFLIKDKDMLGTKTLEIIPGNSIEQINPKEVQSGRSIPGFSDLISNINNLSEKIEALVVEIEDEEKFFSKVSDLVTNVDVSLKSMQFIMNDLRESDMLKSFTELRKASESIQELINQNSEGLVTTLESTNKTFEKVDTLISGTNKILGKFNENLENEDSNLNKLMTDEQLYQNMVKLLKEMDALISDIKAQPHRYFKFSVF